jgi:prophage antirepressor-like protein
MNEITPFNFDFEGHTVRVVDRSGVLWWFLVDVFRVLGILNPSQAAARLEDEEKSTLTKDEAGKFNGLGTVESMPTLINESGLWKEILRSNKPAAKRFTTWVTRDVQPPLRKTGTYSLPSAQQHPSLTTEDRSVVGGIIKLVVANQIRPLFQMQEIDHAHIVALKREIAGTRGSDAARDHTLSIRIESISCRSGNWGLVSVRKARYFDTVSALVHGPRGRLIEHAMNQCCSVLRLSI